MKNDTCNLCLYPCVNCLNETYCYTCGYDVSEGDLRRIRPPSCMCDYQYSDNGERCVLCTEPCETCHTEDTD